MVAIRFRHSEASKRLMSINRSFPVELRFWKFVNKKGVFHKSLNSRCWEWKGSIFKQGLGYGQFKAFAECVAHRVSWVLKFGKIPEGMLVLHKCDNPKCVNPEHLFLGDYLDNSLDMLEKGRGNPVRGEQHHWTVLSEEQVLEIQNKYRRGVFGYKRLAKMYGVSPATIARIINRISWRHLDAKGC